MKRRVAAAILVVVHCVAVDQSDVPRWKEAGVFSREEPGGWEGMEDQLVPDFKGSYGVARVTTPHAHARDHAIDAHWVEDASGRVLNFKDLTEGGIISMLPLPSSALGDLYAFSHSDTYGTWVTKRTIKSHATHSAHSEL